MTTNNMILSSVDGWENRKDSRRCCYAWLALTAELSFTTE